MVAEGAVSTRSCTKGTARGESAANLRRSDQRKRHRPFSTYRDLIHFIRRKWSDAVTRQPQPPARAHHLRSRCSVLYGLAGPPWVLLRACGQAAKKAWQKARYPPRSCTKVLREGGNAANLRRSDQRKRRSPFSTCRDLIPIIRRKWSAAFIGSLGSAGGDPKGHPGQPGSVLVNPLWQGSPQKPNRDRAAFFLAHTTKP